MEARKTSVLKPVPSEGVQSFLPKQDYIQVQNTPGGEIEKILTSEFSRRTEMAGWCETNLIREEDKKAIRAISDLRNIKRAALQAIYRQINQHTDNLVVTYNEQVRYGVSARTDIPANTYFASFSGVLEQKYTATYTSYYNIVIRQTENSLILLNCEQYGNISRFLLHAPDDMAEASLTERQQLHVIQDYRYAGIELSDVLTANAQVVEFTYNKYPLLFLKTTRYIPSGQPIVWDYGRDYWLEQVPLLMKKDGSFINTDHYAVDTLKLIVYRGEKSEDEKHLDIVLTLDMIKENFRKHGSILLKEPDASQVFGISEQLFFTQYYQQPHSLVLVFKEPDIVIKRNEEEKKSSECLSGEKEVSALPTTKSQEGLNSGMTLFVTKRQQVLEELNRISASLPLPKWSYSASTDTAFISTPASSTSEIKKLKDYLHLKALHLEYAFKAGTTDPVLMIKKPSVTQLKSIAAFIERPRLEI